MPTIALVSLGCAKNLVDSELILGRLAEDGYTITTDRARAEIIIVNTCGFITPAKEEAISALLEALAWKKKGRCRLVAGVGCLVQRYGEELRRELPEVDLWAVRSNYGILARLLRRAEAEHGLLAAGSPVMHHDAHWPRLRSTPPHRAYLRIADGCDNRCRYCTIPLIRGAYHSRPPDDILAEAFVLAHQGVVEVDLIAQDTTAYGHDLPGAPSLAVLLRSLLKIAGPRWWRLLYTHPAKIDTALIGLLAEGGGLCRYLDLPLQHISGRILRDMGRPEDPDEVRGLLAELRKRVPDLAIRTTFIAGYPGETEKEFAELLSFLREQRFSWVGVFPFSPEEGTPAAALPLQVPEPLKEERRQQALALQQSISRDLRRKRLGTAVQVLVEGPHPERTGIWIARSEMEAPEVDGLIHVRTEHDYSGKIIPVKIVKAGVYDLEALPLPDASDSNPALAGVSRTASKLVL